MRYVLMGWALALCAGSVSFADQTDVDAVVATAMGAGLQGNVQRAITLLEPLSDEGLSDEQRDYRACILERFASVQAPQTDIPESGAFIPQLIAVFQGYWHQALLQPDLREAYQDQLYTRLRGMLDLPEAASIAQIETAIHQRLQSEGAYGLLGRTGVLRELMIWRQEDRRSVEVEMPYGVYTTQVAFLDDFISAGWGDYATCQRRGASGWVADRTLFAVVPRYDDLEGEVFKVRLLAHETQHFLDFDHYSGLQRWELEYRAKLIELSMADTILHTVFGRFIENQGDDPASPHSYANRRVLTDLMETLSVPDIETLLSLERDVIREAAMSLYDADTAMRDGSSN